MKIWRGFSFMQHITPIRSVNSAEVQLVVQPIIEAVRQRGDKAVREYTEKFDGVHIDDLKVQASVMKSAWDSLSQTDQRALTQAAERIRSFHEKQIQPSWTDSATDGSIMGQLIQPLDRVGVYVPGGLAPYPSSVLMNVIPAKVAGVKEVIMCSPSRCGGELDRAVLGAGWLAGVDELYRVGGAQSIAAMAYGTETISRVDKIVGPGNMFVTAAKKMVFGQVDIDMLAGPSEVMVYADGTVPPAWAAADLLSQAEHDEHAWVVLVTMDPIYGNQVISEIRTQVAQLPRQDIATKSIQNNGHIVLVDSLDEAIQVINHFAPEHLELLMCQPDEILSQIRHAGSIFVGAYSPEPVGDYVAGANHVLPTGGTARFSSALGVDAFVKRTNLIWLSEPGFAKIADSAIHMAQMEGFDAHQRAVLYRRGLSR
jgi:histidinol dehydrogenase